MSYIIKLKVYLFLEHNLGFQLSFQTKATKVFIGLRNLLLHKGC